MPPLCRAFFCDATCVDPASSLPLLRGGSIYLEAIAIVPQLIVLQRFREVDNLDGHYIFLLGSYRALYILNWVYRRCDTNCLESAPPSSQGALQPQCLIYSAFICPSHPAHLRSLP